MEEYRGTVLLGIVEGYALGKVRVRFGDRSQAVQYRPQGTVRRYEHGRVLGLLRQGEKLLAQCLCRLQLGTVGIIIPQTAQHGKKLVRSFQVLTELPSTRVGLSDFRCCLTLRGNERCS